MILPVSAEQYAPHGDKVYTVADLITGYGVSESVRHFYDIFGGELKGKKVIIQGWGNVGTYPGCCLLRPVRLLPASSIATADC